MENRFKVNIEGMVFDYIDKVKYLLSPEIWGNDLFNCSKNEMFLLLLLFRTNDVNMSQIADYLNAPLNTATGIVTRLEKRGLVNRERNSEDKRVVTINLTNAGKGYIKEIIKEITHYGQLIMDSFTPDEIQLVFKLVDKVMDTLSGEGSRQANQQQKESKIRKILIE